MRKSDILSSKGSVPKFSYLHINLQVAQLKAREQKLIQELA